MEVERGRGNGNSAPFSAFVLLDGVAPVLRTGKSNLPSPASPEVNRKSGSFEHRVSRMDTLAGIAIKYGVEVEDIKRVNGLVTDIHMFAHKKLQIPLPGRHPPSPILLNVSSNNGEQTPQKRESRNKVLQSLQTLKLNPSSAAASPAMSILQERNDWGSSKTRATAEGIGLTVYGTRRKLDFEGEVLHRSLPVSEQPPTKCLKSPDETSPGSEVPTEDSQFSESTNTADGSNESSAENSVRRRQKTDAASVVDIQEKSRQPRKSPAVRSKSGSSTDLDLLLTGPVVILDSFMAEGFISAKKSTSTSNLKGSVSSTFLPTKKWVDTTGWPTFFDLLAISTSSWRNKAA